MVACYVRHFPQDLRAATSKFHVDRLYDQAVTRQWESYLVDQKEYILTNSPEKIDDHWTAIKHDLLLSTIQEVHHVPKGRHKI